MDSPSVTARVFVDVVKVTEATERRPLQARAFSSARSARTARTWSSVKTVSGEVISEEGIGLAVDEADGAGEAAFRPDDGSGWAEEASRAAPEDEGREEGVAGWSAGIRSFHGIDDEAGFRWQLVTVGFPCLLRRSEPGIPEELEGEVAEWRGESCQRPFSGGAGDAQFFRSVRERAADEGG